MRDSATHWSVALPSTATHVALSVGSEKGRIACLKTTFKSYVKMEGTTDRTHPFPQFPPYVMIPAHPSSPPLIFTYVKTSEKHRHGQALLAMSVFAFCRQDGVGKTSFSGFCQVKSRRKECPVTDFKACIRLVQEWLKGICEPSGQDMEAWKGMGNIINMTLCNTKMMAVLCF